MNVPPPVVMPVDCAEDVRQLDSVIYVSPIPEMCLSGVCRGSVNGSFGLQVLEMPNIDTGDIVVITLSVNDL